MKEKIICQFNRLQNPLVLAALTLLVLAGLQAPLHAQTVGSISGTVLDASGGVVQDAEVKAHNVATNLELTAHSKTNGSYSISNLPIGTYQLTFSKAGFDTETHTEVLVTGDHTTTIDGALKVGAVSTTVEVKDVALMNETDATNGYVVDQLTIESTPLGTGSFTQLAILAPGVHADFLGGAGSDSGLGNQAIFANGNRDTSNSFSLNGVSTNNLFNGNSTSQVGENRFTFNTGENLNGAGGGVQTSSSVYGAIGQALPTPPTDAIQEISVNTAMYDATQGNNSGAHISVVTKSGTNQIHGSAWEQWQNSDMNATPFFYNAASLSIPYMNRNQYGATLGGPLKKDKLFYFLSYQGVRIADAADSTKEVKVPLSLTDDRSTGAIISMIQSEYGKTLTSSQVNSTSMAILNAKLPNGQFLVPSAQITNPTLANRLGYDAIVEGPNSQAHVDQGMAAVDYAVNDRDRISVKYYIQEDPTSNPIGAAGVLLGFPQKLLAGSDVGSISNNLILTPNITWEQHVGFSRLYAYANTQQELTPSDIQMNLLGSTRFPQIEVGSIEPALAGSLQFGPSNSFGNAGMYQNQWEAESSMNMVKGRNTISIGGQWDHTQLNILNRNASTDIVEAKTLLTFVEGTVYSGDAFQGASSRYYRSDTAGAYINDNFKLRSNLTLTGGVRWDLNGPLSEKYGRLTGFDQSKYSYDVATDTITGSGLEIAGNNANGTPGASNTLLKQHQWGFAPRVGIAWRATQKLTVRAGSGLYYDRGELFSYLSPGAGSGFNGVFGVTLAPPFVEPIAAAKNASFTNPFGTSAPPPPTGNVSNFLSELPNFSQTSCGYPGCWPSGNLFGPLLYGGYDINNKLPYTQNWTLDLQYQASNNWMFEVAYVGNFGVHEILPVPFNEPRIATPQNPLLAGNSANEQFYSYGGGACYEATHYGAGGVVPCQYPDCCNLEPISTNQYSGNAPVRVPYMGYDMNSVTYNAEGTSNYHALQFQVRKRLSHGLQFTGAYTYSHAFDQQSGLGLFVTGNNALTPKANYGSSDFDQTHVFLVNYSYTIPSTAKNNKALGYAVNGWTIGGQTVAQSGQPYSVYDFSGSQGNLYFGTSIYIENPIVALAPGVTNKQAQAQGTTGINAANPVLNAADFYPQFVAPGTNGVPPCDSSGCDVYESLFSTVGRNSFRGPFQVRFDMSVAKAFPIIKDRFQLRFEADAFNIFNHPDFDTPNNEAFYFPDYSSPPVPAGVDQSGLGYLQHTIGSPRFLMLGLHLVF